MPCTKLLAYASVLLTFLTYICMAGALIYGTLFRTKLRLAVILLRNCLLFRMTILMICHSPNQWNRCRVRLDGLPHEWDGSELVKPIQLGRMLSLSPGGKSGLGMIENLSNSTSPVFF
nr:hypothetical protein [Crucivirus sp.]